MEKETKLKLAIGLSVFFMCIELVGGYLANSIAIFSDAAHLLTDVAGFGVALITAIAAKSPGTKHLTFGYGRAEVFGALGSVLGLWVITLALLYAAFERGQAWLSGHPVKVDGFLMFIVACFGVLVNICLGSLFHDEHGGELHLGHSHSHSHHSTGHDHAHDHHGLAPSDSNCHGDGHAHDHGHDHGHGDGHGHAHTDCEHGHDHHHGCEGHDHSGGHTERTPLISTSGHDHGHSYQTGTVNASSRPRDVNLEAAYLHVVADLIQSVGVALAGLLLWFKPDWEIVDPLCTLIFSFVALYATIPLLKRVFLMLFEGIPSHIDYDIVMAQLSRIPGVEDIHDLHIWSISTSSVSLTCHMRAKNPQAALQAAHRACRDLGIDHVTIQVHDAADEHFCPSETCALDGDDAEARLKPCVGKRVK